MKYQGMNLENVKSRNQSAIIGLLYDHGPMSRKDIAEAVGLTAASVTLICTELLENGIIVELGEVTTEKRAGRKKILVDINSDYKKSLCIAIESDETYLCVADLRGGIISTAEYKTDRSMDPEAFLKMISTEGQRLLWDSDVSRDTLLGVGVTIPGRVDHEKGISISSYNIWGKSLPVKDIMEQTLKTDVMVCNNLKAAAEYEILFGRGKREKNLFLLKWGPGVGSAMIIDGRIYMGSHNLAGEIGHTTLENGGKSCSCGKKGCLEMYLSTAAIMEDIEKMTGDASIFREDINRLSDEGLRELMDEKMDRLSRSLGNAISLLDPDRVVVLGDIFEVPGIFDRFRSLYRTYDRSVDEDFIVKSELGSKSGHIAPLAMLLNNNKF